MKRTLFLLLIFLGLLLAYFIVTNKSKQNSSIRIEDREFILKDKEEVEVITIEGKGRPMIHLGKTKDGWYINNKHRANQRIVANMLSTLNRMSIKYIPTRAENTTALSRMKMHGIDIKTFDKKGRVLTDFILGTNTNDEYGTYCLRTGASQSYVMSISSIQGGIRNYFTQSQEEMKDLMVFAYKSNDLRSVTIDYPKDRLSSFSLVRDGADFRLSSNGKQLECNNNIADAYYKDFNSMVCESIRNNHVLRDSIIKIVPFMNIEIKSSKKPDLKLSVYPVEDLKDASTITRSANDMSEAHQRFFVHEHGGNFYMVQAQFVKKFVKKPSYFYRK